MPSRVWTLDVFVQPFLCVVPVSGQPLNQPVRIIHHVFRSLQCIDISDIWIIGLVQSAPNELSRCNAIPLALYLI
jgi:hypothetical protein